MIRFCIIGAFEPFFHLFMSSQEIRRKFLQFYKEKGHVVVPSSPVIPHDDPTLLFINAGMNQFKDVFLGKSVRDYKKAASSQKCIRVGGKHNDLENVGHTSRHLTFFEMLGNFSFGDYFKKEAIDFAWEVTLSIFGYDPDRIWPTVFYEDKEAFELWKRYVPEARIVRMGEKDNFWAMGETGPCGPCSELLYDRGPAFGPARNPAEDLTGERYLEFWNLVFMQFNRDISGRMDPLPKPCVDTGAGLERVVSLKMGVNSLFETDILRELIAQVESLSGYRYDADDKNSPAFRVIADHMRSLAFAIADGVQPSNLDRGYVLRKVLRRAVRYGRMLGMERPFLADVLPRLVGCMGDDFPELISAQERIATILTREEEGFLRTLKRGGNLLSQIIDDARKHANQISGDDAFKLKDTYGLPLEEILLLAKDADLTVDIRRFEDLEREAKERSRQSRKTIDQTATENIYAPYLEKHGSVEFVGYHQLSITSVVLGIFKEGQEIDTLYAGEEGLVLLNKTPFYAEKGGQVGDQGTLSHEHLFGEVTDCRTPYPDIIVHALVVREGELSVGDLVTAAVDLKRRTQIANHHTATHLLHWALQEVLGGHIRQAGSIVEAKRLRFDFSHHQALTNEDIQRIEDLVNEKIRENTSVAAYELPYEEAQKRQEIKQFFGEKYGAKVRVIDIDYTKELCGGTHTRSTGEIGYFRITKESSISSGVRRIEAVTGEAAEAFVRETESKLSGLAQQLKVQPTQITERIEKLVEEHKQLTAELSQLKKTLLAQDAEKYLAAIESHNGVSFLIQQLTVDMKEMKDIADAIMEKQHSLILVLASFTNDKCFLLTRVSPDLVGKGIHAHALIQAIAPIVGGKGGGKPDSAQAGGTEPQRLAEALTKAREWIKNR